MEKRDTDKARQSYWCVVAGSACWMESDQLPFGTASELNLPEEQAIYIGDYQGGAVMWLDEQHVERPLDLIPLRDCLHLPEALFLIISKAIQYGHMTQSMRFCPQCGGRNHLNLSQLAMQCGECRTLHYPRIFPCIIVAVRQQQRILLANHSHHRGGMYTVIAGFLEVGETLEQCVAREVREETGLDVQNIRYFGSQPWAFPSNMMVGFLADYERGELRPDYTELRDARWFEVDELPEIAPQGTIARALIEHTVAQIRADGTQ